METTINITKEMADALASAQKQSENATKNAKNPHRNSRYADLGSVLEAAKPVLASNGLSLVVLPSESSEHGLGFLVTLSHTSGGYIISKATVPVAQKDPQGYGSALTYIRRYSIASILNMWQEDDDANAATVLSGGVSSDKQQPARSPSAQSTSTAPTQKSTSAPSARAAVRATAAKAPGRTIGELIEALGSASTMSAIDSLVSDAVSFAGHERWDELRSVGAEARKRVAGSK